MSEITKSIKKKWKETIARRKYITKRFFTLSRDDKHDFFPNNKCHLARKKNKKNSQATRKTLILTEIALFFQSLIKANEERKQKW